MTTSVPSEELMDYIRFSQFPDFRLWIAKTEEEFYAVAEEALNVAISRMESGRKHWAPLDEPALSKFLSTLLCNAQIPATAEEDSSGHVDITIKHRRGVFVMLGECKLFRAYDYHCKGCAQLLQRYMTGRAGRAFCLEFCKKPEIFAKLSTLRQEIDQRRPLGKVGPTRDHPFIKEAFITTHQHNSGGLVEILHLGCNLFYDPGRDGSTAPAQARSSRKRKAVARRKP